MTHVLLLALALAAALFDRVRGGGKNLLPIPPLPAALCYGAVVALAWSLIEPSMAQGWHLFALAVLFALGSRPGWGSTIGWILARTPYRDTPSHDREEWQRWFPALENSRWLAQAFRGLMWGAAVLPMEFVGVTTWPLALATLLAFTASPLLGRLHTKRHAEDNIQWEMTEIYRGAMVLCFVYAYAVISGKLII